MLFYNLTLGLVDSGSGSCQILVSTRCRALSLAQNEGSTLKKVEKLPVKKQQRDGCKWPFVM